jgi:hypothetical protein
MAQNKWSKWCKQRDIGMAISERCKWVKSWFQPGVGRSFIM